MPALATDKLALEDVLITDQLAARISRLPDYFKETEALGALVDCLAESPQTVLQMLVDKVIELTGAHSSGISVAEVKGNDAIFRWRATAGNFARYVGATMPRFNSPCGTVLARNSALLMHQPERYYPFTQPAPVPIVEVLSVPFYKGKMPIGTVWAMAHTAQKTFDNEDKRLITSLSRFASAAVKSLEHLQVLEAATTELSRESRQKTEFIATLSHELRNPLSPIVTAVAVLEQATPESPCFRKAVNIIERQTRQLTRLVDELLDVSRAATNKLDLRKSRTSLSEALGTAIETSSSYISMRGHRFQAVLPKEEIYLEADRSRLAQAVANLLNNSSRYTPHGGDITLSAQRNTSEVAISVKDNGVGIQAERLTAIFDMFTQGGAQNGGLGIGLTLVKRIVELHGGTIEANSKGLNLGSEFVMRLPLTCA